MDEHAPHNPAEFRQALAEHDEWFRHTPDEPQHQEMHGQLNAWLVIGFLAITVFGVAVTSALVYHYMRALWRDARDDRLEARTELIASEYRDASGMWAQQLSNNAWINPEAGTVRLTLEQASDKVIRQYEGR